MNLSLTEAEEAKLRERALAQGITPEALVRAAIGEVIRSEPQGADAPRISRVIAEIMKDAPSEEIRKLPRDGASEHDHYLYGWPKKNQ